MNQEDSNETHDEKNLEELTHSESEKFDSGVYPSERGLESNRSDGSRGQRGNSDCIGYEEPAELTELSESIQDNEISDETPRGKFALAISNALDFVSMNSSRLCQSVWVNRVVLAISVANNVYVVLQAERNIFDETTAHTTDVVFACSYLFQTLTILMSFRFGAMMRESIFNRLDFIAMLAAWISIAWRSHGAKFNLCSLRLLRLMHPLTRYSTFAVLDAILHTLNDGWAAVGTILALIAASILVLGIVGVYAYSGSFRRRCVWADTLELKVPEQFCTRYAENGAPGLGLHSNCGPLQVCLYSFWQRDHLFFPFYGVGL